MSTHTQYPRIEIYPDTIGQYRYRLISAGKAALFESVCAFTSQTHAKQAARAALKAASMTDRVVVLPHVEAQQ